MDFNPRTPCGVRLVRATYWTGSPRISIHAPLAGCDNPEVVESRMTEFQSTHPLRGATMCYITADGTNTDFNPRTPCGVRRRRLCAYRCIRPISIHAPLAGCDFTAVDVAYFLQNFNPRTPCGVRRRCRRLPPWRCHFNPRTPCGVRRRLPPTTAPMKDFNPRTPCGVRQQKRTKKTALFLN